MPDGMNTVRVPIGSLAARYYRAVDELIAVERQTEQLIAALYESFSEWEAGPDGIDIYDAIDSTAAAQALMRAGWKAVRCHNHERRRFKHCACAIRRDLL